MKRIHSLILLLTLCMLMIVGCSPSQTDKQDTDLTIYTSIYPLQYITEQIAGETTAVTSIYPPGVDAHTYEPTSREITAIADSDAFIYLGAGMEGFAETAAEALNSHDVSFIELGKHEELFHPIDEADDHGHDHGDHDPHIWLDPLRMIAIAEIIQAELTNLSPTHQELYANNFDTLKAEMLKLDQEFTDVLSDKTEKHILVSHAAYGYWEERYGMEQIAISGLSSESEPSQRELTKIVALAKDKDLKYVIFEQNGSDRVSTIIQEHIKAEALHIHNLEVLTDEDIKNNEDYLSLMRKNLSALNKATD